MGVRVIMAAKAFHDFTFKTLSGKSLAMSQFKSKVVLVVNVASL